MIDEQPKWVKIINDLLIEKEKERKGKSDIKNPTNEELEKMTMSEIIKMAKETAIQELKQEGVEVKDDEPNECCKRYCDKKMGLIIDIISNPNFWKLWDKVKKK